MCETGGDARRDPLPAGKVSFGETGKVFTMPVTLEPDHDCEFNLSWPGGGSFASEKGVPLKHLQVRFRTRPGRD